MRPDTSQPRRNSGIFPYATNASHRPVPSPAQNEQMTESAAQPNPSIPNRHRRPACRAPDDGLRPDCLHPCCGGALVTLLRPCRMTLGSRRDSALPATPPGTHCYAAMPSTMRWLTSVRRLACSNVIAQTLPLASTSRTVFSSRSLDSVMSVSRNSMYSVSVSSK